MNDEASVTISVTGNADAEAATVLAALLRRAAETPEATAFTDSPDRTARSLGTCRTVTYRQAAAIVERVKREFLELGLKAGDIVAIQAPNIVEVPLIVFGAWHAGIVPCLMPVMWQLDEIDHAFSLIKPKAAISVAQYGPDQPAVTFGEAAARQMSIRFVMALGDEPPDGITPIDTWFNATDAEHAPGPGDPNNTTQPQNEELAVLTWMTGRFGNQPVPRTHEQLLALARMFVAELDLRQRDILLNPYPYANIAALAGQLAAPVLAGAQTVLHLPFDFATYVEQLETHRITCAIAPAPVISALEDRRDLHSTKFKLRKLGCVWPGPHTVKSGPGLFEPSLPTIDIHNFTEFAILPRSREPGSDPSLLPLGKIKADSENKVLLETRIRGSVTTRDEKQVLNGSLTVRGLAVPGGTYLIGEHGVKNDERPVLYQADAQGFVDTGIGAVAGDDISGFFRCQKSEDIIYHGGTALSASDLDDLYCTFDEFLDAAVFALEDAAVGERIFAAVVPQPDLSPSLDRFRDYLAHKRVAPYKVPDQLIIVRSIPRNSDGAVLRDQILSQI